MSGQLESALVIQLADAIPWRSSLEPTSTTGQLTQVDLNAPLDVIRYARRDRELLYRDMINATAVVKVSLHIESVWNGATLRPSLQTAVTDQLPYVLSDVRRVDSTVLHVKNSSVPKDALDTDKDLAGRDALVYEVLARACQEFKDPPLRQIDPTGASITNVTAWSLAEGVDFKTDVNPSLPLNRDLFKMPDQTAADRDNKIAAYVATMAQVMKNPFAYATRLYISVNNVDAREVEIYTLVRNNFVLGNTYEAGDEVFFGTGWFRALVHTVNSPTTSDWVAIGSQTLRTWTTEPALEHGNKIVYNTKDKTLQWFREITSVIHQPQLFALVIDGMFVGQTITTVPAIPEATDAQYWKQKASRISYGGVVRQHIDGYLDTTVLNSGVKQPDTTGFSAPASISIPFKGVVTAGSSYRFSALVKPDQKVVMLGQSNASGVSGTRAGATFVGNTVPTPTKEGDPVSYQIQLPSGSWKLTLGYTNLSGLTTGFGIRVIVNGQIAMQDAVPLLFQDSDGSALPNGQIVQSTVIPFTTDGGAQVITIAWTYGSGQFHLSTLSFESTDHRIGRYAMQADMLSNGTSIVKTPKPTIDAEGQKLIYSVMPFDLRVASSAVNPTVVMTWNADSELPLQVRQAQLQANIQVFTTPEITGFSAWRQECLNRAERSVQKSFATFFDGIDPTAIPEFTLDGTLWDKNSTENWMALVETNQARLREVSGVSSISLGHQYQVFAGTVSYLGGNYFTGDKFYGTNVPTFTKSANGRLDQVGAFSKAYPGHIGRPALVPLGLRFDGQNIVQDNETIDQVPTITPCQPWMIEAGVYTAGSAGSTLNVGAEFSMPEVLLAPGEDPVYVPPPSPPSVDPIRRGFQPCPAHGSFPVINGFVTGGFVGISSLGFHQASETLFAGDTFIARVFLADAVAGVPFSPDKMLESETGAMTAIFNDTANDQMLVANNNGTVYFVNPYSRTLSNRIWGLLSSNLSRGSWTYDPKRGRFYIVEVGTGTNSAQFIAIDCTTVQVLYRIAVPVDVRSMAYANSIDKVIFITDLNTALYHTFDPDTHAVAASSVPTDAGAGQLHCSYMPDIDHLIVENSNLSQLKVVKIASSTLLATISTPGLFHDAAYDQCSNVVFVSEVFGNKLYKFNPNDYSLLATVTTNGASATIDHPRELRYDRRQNYMWLNEGFGGTNISAF